MYDRLYEYVIELRILYEYQFGFQKKKSTYMAIICLLDKLIKALEKGEFGIGVFIDFRKAFDTVDHQILLDKLHHYGIRGTALTWFTNYLCNRKQFVEFENTKSSLLSVKCGVPQGSILGPLLFLIYINDLAHVSPKLFAILFADDSNFFCTGPNLNELVTTVNHELKNIVHWLNANRMSLNVEKTHYIVFSNRGKTTNLDTNVQIAGSVIEKVNFTKFLGIIIDKNLTWKFHVDHVCSKISKNIGIILRCRKIFDQNTLVTLYNSFIEPYIQYGIHIWGSTYASYLKKSMFYKSE